MENVQQLLQTIKMEPLINKALKGAALGAGVGFCWWIGKQILPAAQPFSAFDELTADANQALASDPEVRLLCERFNIYARHDHASYASLLQNWSELIDLYVQISRHEITPKMSHPRKVATHCSHVVEAIRKLRAFLCVETHNNRNALGAFDEIAADFQRKCNEYTHNITKTIEYEQIK